MVYMHPFYVVKILALIFQTNVCQQKSFNEKQMNNHLVNKTLYENKSTHK